MRCVPPCALCNAPFWEDEEVAVFCAGMHDERLTAESRECIKMKFSDEDRIIERLASMRSNLVELMLVAGCLGFGVWLAASVLSGLFQSAMLWGMSLGLAVAFCSLAYLCVKVLIPRPETFRVRGFLHLAETDKDVDVKPVYRYKLSEEIDHYLHASFAENRALLNAWLSSPIGGLKRPTADRTALSAIALTEALGSLMQGHKST